MLESRRLFLAACIALFAGAGTASFPALADEDDRRFGPRSRRRRDDDDDDDDNDDDDDDDD